MRSTTALAGLALPLAALMLFIPARADDAVPTSARDGAIQDFLKQRVGTVPLKEATGQTRSFTLEIRKTEGEIAPGVKVAQWAFALPGQRPSVPGPEIRVKEGDLVRITVRNTDDQPHSAHLHGIADLAQSMDGVPHHSLLVKPGESYTYEFVATRPGTHAYHCHVDTFRHVDMGMYGALIVEPRDDASKFWQIEKTFVVDEWDSKQDPYALKHDPHPDYAIVNGKTAPLLEPVSVPKGTTALFRFVNIGNYPHSLHLHGNHFLVVSKDGYPVPAPWEADTILIGPGERYDVLLRGRDGSFPMHDHAGQWSSNAGVDGGGIHFTVQGGPALAADGSLAPATGADHTNHTVAAPATVTPIAAPATPVKTEAAAHDHGAAPAASPALASVPAQAASAEATVKMGFFAYAPKELRVKAGTSVTWVNNDLAAHVVNVKGPKGQVAKSAGIGRGGSFKFTFSEPGVYEIHCDPHPYMNGKVVVE
jgi:FtsP/CotA-like multicopper oxidase with cupredoxin domain